jgi:hypothetical protein
MQVLQDTVAVHVATFPAGTRAYASLVDALEDVQDACPDKMTVIKAGTIATRLMRCQVPTDFVQMITSSLASPCNTLVLGRRLLILTY